MEIEWMPMYIHIIFSFLAATGFAVFLTAPRKTVFASGAVGMVSWIIYVILMRLNLDVMFSNFVAASVAEVISEKLARKYKKPTILFVVPGIITLIPGLGLYNTMFYVLEGNFNQALTTGTNVMFASGAIALGVIVTASWYKTHNSMVRRNKIQENKNITK